MLRVSIILHNNCYDIKLSVSDVEQEVDYVAVLHHIVLALGAQPTLFAGRRQASSGFYELVVGNGLRTYEAALEVRMYLSGSLRRLGAAFYGPGPGLVVTGGQEGYEIQQTVGCLYKLVPAALLYSQFLQEHLLLVVVQFRYLRFQARADAYRKRTFRVGYLLYGLYKQVAVRIRGIVL